MLRDAQNKTNPEEFTMRRDLKATLAGSVIVLTLAAHGALADDEDDAERFDRRPWFIRGEVSAIHYDGVSNDLLTGGLGKTGLAGGAPGFADPAAPTAAELRTRAIYTNYRALIDVSSGGGYGELYGPNVTADGTQTSDEGFVPGTEVIAFADNGSGRVNVTLMVQVPDSFDPDAPCIVTAPSSGSRGVYGAIGTAGEWGLKNGCAVAYTDKGGGTGAHSLSDDTVGLIDGLRASADDAGKASTFTAPLSDSARMAYDAQFPDRFAFKHAHSRRNPEKDWGRNVLQSIRFAFWVLNDRFGNEASADNNEDGDKDSDKDSDKDDDGDGDRSRFRPDNTIVIASSVSNGGGASILAAELDVWDLVDGVAVSEPNVNPRFDSRFAIRQGDGPPLFDHSRSLYDYITVLNVYQGCASADPAAISDDLGPPPFNFAASPAACESLRELGLVSADDLEGQAAESQAAINAAGILEEQNVLTPSHWFINVPQAVAVTYANAYARASVTDNLCGYSFGETAVDPDDPTAPPIPAPVPLGAEDEAALFATSSGIPPTGEIDLINNDGPDGPRENRASTPNQNLAGALCLRSLAEGRDAVTGERLRGQLRRVSRRLARGVRQVRAHGNLRGKPAIVATGRADALLPPNHTSRAYFGLNQLREGKRSQLVYIEVLNAQHLDAFNGFGGFNERYIPLHHYFVQALDLMLAHLRHGEPLPQSQVVRTIRRGAGAPPLTLANLPDIATTPASGDAIVFEDGEVRIPD